MLEESKENVGRKIFDKPIGELAVAFALIPADALTPALTIQARYGALALAGHPVELSAAWHSTALFSQIRNQWEEVAAQYQVSSAHLTAAQQQVEGAQADPQHIPPMGGLLCALHTVEPQALHGLLTAQAAQRILDTTKAMIAQTPHPDIPSLEEARNLPLWHRAETPDNPEFLTGRQHVLCVAQLLQSAIQLHPPLATTGKIERAEAALIMLALEGFQDAEKHFPALRAQTQTMVQEESTQWKLELPITLALAHTALQAVHAGIDAADTSLGQRYVDEQIEQQRQQKMADKKD